MSSAVTMGGFAMSASEFTLSGGGRHVDLARLPNCHEATRSIEVACMLGAEKGGSGLIEPHKAQSHDAAMVV